MSPALARPLLHTAHLLTFTVLLVTGVLLFAPSLRAVVTGGYSQLLRTAHRWGGVVFAVLPLLIVARFGLGAVVAAPAVRTLRTLWQGLHVWATVLMTVLFTVTGFVIWWKRWIPESLVDTSHTVHDGLTYVAAALLGAHLLEAGASSVVARVRATAGPTES